MQLITDAKGYAEAVGNTDLDLPDGPPIHLDPATRRVWVQGRQVYLTGAEYAALRLMTAAGGAVLSYDAIRRVALPHNHNDPGNRCVIALIHNMRNKLVFDKYNRQFVFSIRGIGYGMPTGYFHIMNGG